MVQRRFNIDLKDGVRVETLLTPALYGVGLSHGIDLRAEIKPDEKDSTAILRLYTKCAYCAALNAWEVAAVDNPDKGRFPYTFADFDTWSWDNQPQLLEFIDAFLLVFTGKGLKEQVPEDVKKKRRR